MKNFKIISCIIIAFAIFSSCEKAEENLSPELFGFWASDKNADDDQISETLVFNRNNTGLLSILTTEDGLPMKESIEFVYDTEGNQLIVVMKEETNYITYSVSENKLTITEEDESTTYTKLDIPSGSSVNYAVF